MPERKINYSAINSRRTKELEYIDKQLLNAGYGYVQRLAILGNVQRESSGNPLAVSSNGLGHGMIQGDKNRYRIQSNNEQEELKRQTDLLVRELDKKGGSGLTGENQIEKSKLFKDSTDLKDAINIFTKYFVRPSNIDKEINKRLNIAQSGGMDLEDPEYDLDTAKKVLSSESINEGRKNPEENHLPTGYTDDNEKYHYLKSTQHKSYPESIQYEKTDPETMRAMSVYGNADNYVSKFLTYSPTTSVPKSLTNFDLIYKPMILKKQKGGNLVYQEFNTKKLTPKEDYEEFDYLNFTPDRNDEKRFPIEPVAIYNPKEILETQESEQESEILQTPQIKPENSLIQRGTVEYKHNDMDLGNMKELIDAMQEDGISFRVTSASRPGSRTSNGSMSHHSTGHAIDIVPIDGDGDKLINGIMNGEKTKSVMRKNDYGILDERSKEMQKRTGATGAHLHIGPDKITKRV